MPHPAPRRPLASPWLIGLQPRERAPLPDPEFLHPSDWRARAFYEKTGRRLSWDELHASAGRSMARYDAMPPSLQRVWNEHGAIAVRLLLKKRRGGRGSHTINARLDAIARQRGITSMADPSEIGI